MSHGSVSVRQSKQTRGRRRHLQALSGVPFLAGRTRHSLLRASRPLTKGDCLEAGTVQIVCSGDGSNEQPRINRQVDTAGTMHRNDSMWIQTYVVNTSTSD